ncbi:MAG: cobalamin [Pseudomonadota bacterium]|jgi:sirohydrochlorin cobaltochelatase
MTIGVVLFGHGARDPRWRDTIDALAARLAAREPGLPVRAAFLEFMRPDLGEAVASLADEGVREVVVAPVFLAAGGHVLRDLPDRLAQIAATHPGLAVRVEPALGSLPAVLDAMAAHCVEVVSRATPVGDARSAAADGASTGVHKGVDEK